MRSAVFALVLVVPLGAVPKKDGPPAYSPTFMQASASQRGQDVIVQLFRPGPTIPPEDPQAPYDRYRLEWVAVNPVTLGKTAHAFGTDGKPLDARAVLRCLAQPKGVAVFLRSYPNDPETPAEFYRCLLRPGLVILMVKPQDIYNAPPGIEP